MRFVILLLILLPSLWLRLANLSQIPQVLLQKELKIGLSSLVVSQSNIYESINFFTGDFGFINTQFIAPLPILLTTPFIKAFGLTPFAIRLPSVLVGITTIVLFYFLSKEVYKIFKSTTSKKEEFFPLLATFFFAFSPWHIQVSRIDTGVNLGLFFFLLGLFLSLKVLKLKKLNLFWILLFLAAIYSDYIFFIPAVLVICITLILLTRLKHTIMSLAPAVFIAVILLAPILSRIYIAQIQIDQVNSENFMFNSQKAQNRMEKEGNTKKSKILNDPRVENVKLYLKNITDYLEPASLFVRWGYNSGYISKHAGLLQPLELIFLIAGSIFLLKNNRKISGLLTFFIASIVLAQAIQNNQPGAIRMVLILVPAVIIESYGFFYIMEKLSHKFRPVFLIGVIIITSYFIGRFAYFFFAASGIKEPDYYMDYKKAFEYTNKNVPPHQKIFVTDATYGHDLPLYWIFLTKRENLVKKYITQNATNIFDNYIFLKEIPKKYKNSTVYIQPFVTIPKYYPAAFTSNSNDKNLRISVFITPVK